MVLTPKKVIETFDAYSRELAKTAAQHALLAPFFSRNFGDISIRDRTARYAAYLKCSAYVRDSVPLMRAAGLAIQKSGEPVDVAFGKDFVEVAEGEVDHDAAYAGQEARGHEVWIDDDLRSIGAPESFVTGPAPLIVTAGR